MYNLNNKKNLSAETFFCISLLHIYHFILISKFRQEKIKFIIRVWVSNYVDNFTLTTRSNL